MYNIYQEVSKSSKTLMFREPFYGLFLISLNKTISESIKTACVTPDNMGFKLVINPKFWESLDKDTKLGVLKHELLHIAFFHLQNFERFPNKKLSNIAADLEINQYIESEYKGEKWDGLEIHLPPFKELELEEKKGTKYYYDKLQSEIDKNPEGDVSNYLKSLEGDIHNLWDLIKDMNEAERKLIQKQVDHQLKEIASEMKSKSQGTIPNELSEYIDGLFEVTPPVLDWKSYMRRFSNTSNKIYTKKTRKKPNKRFPKNPALKIKPQKSTLVAIDTSASVSNDEVKEFFNEIHHIYKTGTRVVVIDCDTIIQRVYEYKGNLEKIEVKGRGGTSFDPVIDYLIEHKREFNNLIYLTDGECGAPRNKTFQPILWVHSSRSKINEELPGQKIKIN